MAVYTELLHDDLAIFIDSYDVGKLLSFQGITEGVENSNFLIVTTNGRYILTLYEKRVNPQDLPFFLGLMAYLSSAGLGCPVPIQDRNGHKLRELASRPAVLVSFLSGVCTRTPSSNHCQEAGAALARLHKTGRNFTMRRHNALGPHSWRPLFEQFKDRADEICDGLGGIVSAELDRLLLTWPKNLPDGIIHADLFPDNMFFLENTFAGVIDFYFSCNDFLAYDLAICINAWCFEQDCSFNYTKGKSFFEGYQQERPLIQEEKQALPMLSRGAALRFLLTRSYDWLNVAPNALVRPHDPLDYLYRLLFHQSVQCPTEYGLCR
ncbi:MAG: homoserine kinase [Hyphomicrobiaceae bacterium]|nr:homoserine kinase [Hyphomicrobiaceae bacterium]